MAPSIQVRPCTGKEPTVSDQTSEGYAPVNGLDIYWQSRGSGGVPLVVVHGGYAVISTLDGLLDSLARDRRVVAVELQGHGHTADIDRPFTWEAFGDDLAALMGHLELEMAHERGEIISESLPGERTIDVGGVTVPLQLYGDDST